MARPCLGVALFLAVTSALCGQTGLEKPLLTNGGFEDGLEGWQADAAYELVADPDAARSGQNCLTGEVTTDNTHLTLARTLDLRVGALYTLRVWARGTNNTKIAVWRSTAAGDRENIAQWQNQRPKWTLNEAAFTVEKSGEWKIELIAPSSHGAPAGRVWVDDIQLTVIDVPEPLDVSKGEGFNDCVTMAPMGDALCLAWISFRDGADTLQAAIVTAEGRIANTWQIAGGPDTYILEPYLASDRDEAWLLYAAETDGDWEIMACRITPAGPDDPIRVTSQAGVDIRPKGAVREGSLWLAWEASRGGLREIRAASLNEGRVSKPQRLSTPGTSNYDPCVAAHDGIVVAWSTYQDGNQDVVLARHDGKRWNAVERLTTAPTMDRHPTLCAAGPDLWIAWENAGSRAYKIGASSYRRVAVAKLTPEGLMEPTCLEGSPLWQRAEAADLLTDDLGRLWVAYLKPRDRAGWEVFIHCLTGDACSQAFRASAKKGMDRPLSLAMLGGKLAVAFQADTIPAGWATIEDSSKAVSQACLATLDISEAPSPSPIALRPYTEPDDPYEAADIRVARGEESQSRLSLNDGGERLRLFWGDLHEHTDVSVCNRSGDQSIDESYQSMRDIARYDFAAATDHGYNVNPYLWNFTAKLARANCDPGRFLTFLGEEWTSSIEEYSDKYPEGFYGHRNLILEDPYWPFWYNSRDRKTPKELWSQLADEGASFVHIPHQLADTGNVPCDWEQVNEAAQPVAEIFQARGSYEYEGTPRQAGRTLTGSFIQDAWARGVVIGIIASPDHGGGMGKAAVFAPELTRKAVLEAIRKRHTYGTTAAKILLDARVDGHLMGEKIERTGGGPVTVDVKVICPQDIARVDICRNNQFIYTLDGSGPSADFTYQDTDPVAGPSYYYVRAIQTDDEIAWSSPVWLQPG